MVAEETCKTSIERMLDKSQTKVIFPILTFGLLKAYIETSATEFSDREVRQCYENAVRHMTNYLKHALHIGGKYYDAYPARNLPKYGVLRVVGNKQYELLPPFTTYANVLLDWIPERINQHIIERLGLIPILKERRLRVDISEDGAKFLNIVKEYIDKNPTNFEIFSFAIMKVHLEKFACKIYRDTRTSAHDKGVDLSTNFGVVYQVKKLKIRNKMQADEVYAQLRTNFDNERLSDGNVILVIDDIASEIKKYLINMKVQSISKNNVLELARQFEDEEEREKALRIVYEEFRREYASDVK